MENRRLQNYSRTLTLLLCLLSLPLQATQPDYSSLPPRQRAHLLFALANASANSDNPADALPLYKEIISLKRIDPTIAAAARLNYAKRGFDLLPQEKRSIHDPDTLAFLALLNDLQIQKRLQEEPLHLEAGLEYARIRASLEPLEQQLPMQLVLYNKMKEEFTGRDNILSKEYHDNRTQLPEKDRLYHAYLTLLDAHIARLESIKAKSAGNLSEMRWKADAARTLYFSLLKNKESLTAYLKEQINLALAAMATETRPQ